MATLIEDVAAALNTLAPAGRVWYGVNTTEPPVYPYIVFLRVVSTVNNTLQGPSDQQSTRIQVDVYSRQISEAAAIEVAVETAMSAATVFSSTQISQQDLYEDAVKAFRCSSDYSVWSTH